MNLDNACSQGRMYQLSIVLLIKEFFEEIQVPHPPSPIPDI